MTTTYTIGTDKDYETITDAIADFPTVMVDDIVFEIHEDQLIDNDSSTDGYFPESCNFNGHSLIIKSNSNTKRNISVTSPQLEFPYTLGSNYIASAKVELYDVEIVDFMTRFYSIIAERSILGSTDCRGYTSFINCQFLVDMQHVHGGVVNIVNNTFLEVCGSDSVVSFDATSGVFKNNIVCATQEGTGYLAIVSNSSSLEMDCNLYYNFVLSNGQTWGYEGDDYTTLGDWQTASELDVHSLVADPLFTSRPIDLSLATGSPAIDAGATLRSITNDFNGALRPQGIGYDIGAFEAICTGNKTIGSGKDYSTLDAAISDIGTGIPLVLTDDVIFTIYEDQVSTQQLPDGFTCTGHKIIFQSANSTKYKIWTNPEKVEEVYSYPNLLQSCASSDLYDISIRFIGLDIKGNIGSVSNDLGSGTKTWSVEECILRNLDASDNCCLSKKDHTTFNIINSVVYCSVSFIETTDHHEISVVNNTLYVSNAPGYIFSFYNRGNSGCTLRNNIIFSALDSEAGDCFVDLLSTSTITLDYNLYYGWWTPKFKLGEDTYTSLSAWQSATSKDGSSLNVDPMFSREPTNLTLKKASPAVDAGFDTSRLTDIIGTLRPQGSGYDIGAYEYTLDSEKFRIGDNGAYSGRGWFDEFRVSKGVCRITGAHTPPNRPFDNKSV
jgi:hypothetical protein